MQETKVRGIMMPRNKAPSVLCVLLASLVLQGAAVQGAPLADLIDAADPDTTTELDLSEQDPDLTGPIPTSVGLLTKMTKFWVAKNAITSSIPTEVGLLTKMQSLRLDKNLLTGPIPTEIGQLARVTYVAVSGNSLSGRLPAELAVLSSGPPTKLFVHDNEDLCGPLIPINWMLTDDTTYLDMYGSNCRYWAGGYCTVSDPGYISECPLSGAESEDPHGNTCEVGGWYYGWYYYSAAHMNGLRENCPIACDLLERTQLGDDCPDPSADKDNRNGIMRAAISGDTTNLAVALADPVQYIDRMDNTTLGYNALMLAAQYDHQDVVRMLLDAGADTGLLTTVQPQWAHGSFTVNSGACTLNSTGSCFYSPGYPSNYGANQRCDIGVHADGDVTLLVRDMDLEENPRAAEPPCFDYLTVDGVEYCGTFGPDGVQVEGTSITFLSNSNNNRGRFEICGTVPSPEENWSNVMVAAWYGHTEILAMFLDASTQHLDTPCENKQMTPLHAAVTRGNCDIAAILVLAGADANALDSDGKTPLHYAVERDSCAEDLLVSNALDKDNRNGIMRMAVSGDTTNLAVALADPTQNIDRMDNTTLGYNALMLAAQYDHQDVVRMLLDAGANTGLLTSTAPPIFTVNSGRCTVNSPGSCFFSPGYPFGYGGVQQCDISVHGSVTLSVEEFDVEEWYGDYIEEYGPCYWDYLTVDGAKYCGNYGPDGVQVEDTSITFLSNSYEYDQYFDGFEICGTVTPPDENNWSNVMVAAWYGDQEILSMFLDASLDHLNTPCDNKQMTPLHAAVSQDHCNTAAILIDAGANVDALDSDGKTPLHYAAKDGNYKCLMTLMHAGADASIEDDMGNTAYTLAQAGDHQKIMTALSVGGYLRGFVARLFGPKA